MLLMSIGASYEQEECFGIVPSYCHNQQDQHLSILFQLLNGENNER